MHLMTKKLEFVICKLDPKMSDSNVILQKWNDVQPRKVFDDISIGKDIFEEYVDFKMGALGDMMKEG